MNIKKKNKWKYTILGVLLLSFWKNPFLKKKMQVSLLKTQLHVLGFNRATFYLLKFVEYYQKLDPLQGELFLNEDWSNMTLLYQELIDSGLLQYSEDSDL